MPILRFVAVTGAILLALLFVADATLTPRGPLFTNDSVGLPRAQPIRPQEAELPPEPPRPRAPALVQLTPAEIAAANPSRAAPPAAAIVEVAAEAAPLTAPAAAAAAPQVSAEVAGSEPAKAEPARVEPVQIQNAKAETRAAEAVRFDSNKKESGKSDAINIQRAAAETREAAPPPKTRKQTARKHEPAARKLERSRRYAAYRDGSAERDDVPAVENGHPYGVPFRREREWQRPWAGEFGQDRFRF